jgi:hypothetical protein
METAVEKRDLSVSMGEAHLYGMLTPLPFIALLVMLFVMGWGWEHLLWRSLAALDNGVASMAALVIGVVAHELLHGLAWGYFGRKPLCALKFGFQWKTLTPYAHCKEPLSLDAYRLGSVTPGVALGIIPGIMGVYTGDAGTFLFGLLFTLAAGGDFLVLWLLRSVPAGSLVEDHPTRAGCYVVEAQVAVGV